MTRGSVAKGEDINNTSITKEEGGDSCEKKERDLKERRYLLSCRFLFVFLTSNLSRSGSRAMVRRSEGIGES